MLSIPGGSWQRKKEKKPEGGEREEEGGKGEVCGRGPDHVRALGLKKKKKEKKRKGVVGWTGEKREGK